MKKALILIDYVNDFVADKGTLTCGEPAQIIKKNIEKAIDKFSVQDFIVIANDKHQANDTHNIENNLFPEHCLENTWGRELFANIDNKVKAVKTEQLIMIDKIRYSAFVGTNLDMLLRERNIKDIYLAGVCSDICVLHSAIDAYNLGYKINIYADAIASFNQTGHDYALQHFKTVLGANIISI